MTPNMNQVDPLSFKVPDADDPDDCHDPDDDLDEVSTGPSTYDRWQEMAEKGDVRGLLNETSQTFGAQISMDTLCRCVHHAIEKLARDDPAAFVRFLESDMLTSVGKMVIRAHTLVDKGIRQQANQQGIWSDQPGFDKLSEKVMALNVEVEKLLHIRASTQLLLERARKLKLANDKVEKQRNRPPRPRRQRISRPQPMTANSRIGGDLP